MRYMILATILALGHVAVGATKPVPTYTLDNGKQVSAMQAMSAALNGEKVMKCELVQIQLSKSGTSFSLHKPKKAKGE